MKRKLIAILLALIMVLCLLPTSFAPTTAAADTVETYALEHVQGGAILHCFDWSFNEIKKYLPQIAAAGYTAVQTSPVQQPKDYKYNGVAGNVTADEWWKLYQPLGLRIAPTVDGQATSWLGTREDLADLCSAADTYGIKVIVDVVANHVANKTGGGGWEQVSEQVDPWLRENIEDYFHSYTAFVNDGSRFNMTQYQMGMPDLNTGNADIQNAVLAFLKDCIDCGVDGFRFDAAKHIELPTDEGCASNFWPTVVNGAKAYYQTKTGKELFVYGEILGGAGTAISNYTTYMAVTDNETGNSARYSVVGGNAGGLANYYYYKGAGAENSVLWAESHDTYLDHSSDNVSDENIIKTWAIVGARNGSTSLFLARPGEATMGQASEKLSWLSKAVTEINKFKNHFDGTAEYLSSKDNVAYIERGTNGVVISKLDGGGEVSLAAHRMKDGDYPDQITGNPFTVENGVISGTVGPTGVAVVYDPNKSPIDYITVPTLYLKPNSEWTNDGARFAIYVYNSATRAENWAAMNAVGDTGYYQADVPAGEWTNVIFCRLNGQTTGESWDNTWNQTVDLFPDPGTNCFEIEWKQDDNKYDGEWSLYGTISGGPGYYLVGNMNGWSIGASYQLTKNDNATGNEYWIGAELNVNSRFKIAYSEDGESIKDYYPDPGKDYGESNELTQNGTYTIYFRPEGNGGDGWFHGCILVNPVSVFEDSNAGYYLVGNMTNWEVDPAYKLTLTNAEAEEYTIENVALTTASQLKVVYSADGESTSIWYPDPSENYGQNREITKNGKYKIRFLPNYTGGSDWFKNCLYAELTEEDPSQPLADGYYLIGRNGWTVDDIDAADKFEVNPGNPNEYMLNTTLVKGNQLKVVRVENEAITEWYPSGTGNHYTVDIDHSGAVAIYFQTMYKGDWSAFGGYMYIEVKGPCFYGQSLTLSGDIGVNFYMVLPTVDGISYTDSYMTFAIPHGEITSDVSYRSAKSRSAEIKGFSCYINAIQMAEPITATFHYQQNGEWKEIEITRSVEDYFRSFDKDPSAQSETAQALIRATADYGYYMQIYLAEEKGWTLGEDYAKMERPYKAPTECVIEASDIADYKVQKVIEGEEQVVTGSSLQLDSTTALRVYVKRKTGYTGELTFKLDGADYEATTTNGYQLIEIKNIAAKKLGDAHTIVITTTDDDTMTLTISALSYIYSLLNSEKGELDYVKNAAAAIYYYAKAAEAYLQ